METFSVIHWIIVLLVVGGFGWAIIATVSAKRSATNTGVQPVGLGGWLMLLAIGQTLAPLRLIAVMIQNAETYPDVLELPNGRIGVAGEVVINLVFLAIVSYTTIAMYRRSRRFPSAFLYQWLAIALVIVIDFTWVSLVFDLPLSKILDANADAVSKQSGAFLATGLWVWYVFASVRVRNTFVN